MGLSDPPVPVEKTTIEKVEVNPKLDDSLFTKPQLATVSTASAVR